MALSLGTRVGPYEITAQIGAGGMGEVYRATDTNLKRAVAIKVLPESVASDTERLARFQREAEVLAALNHPNIAAIFGLERSDGATALIMELVEGPTLADRIAQGPVPLEEALPIARQIAAALEAAHEQGIAHHSVNRGAAWLADQTIIHAASANSGLIVGAAHGETQRSIVDWSAVTDEEAAFSWPDALPGGRSALFTDNGDQRVDGARVAHLSLDTREVRPLALGGTNPRYSPTGHILYGRRGSLYAVSFDVEHEETTGSELRVLENVASDGNGSVQYAVGGNGTLAYVSSPHLAAQYELVWFPASWSPDGEWLLFVATTDGPSGDILMLAPSDRGNPTALVQTPADERAPAVSPDGNWLAYVSNDTGRHQVYVGPFRGPGNRTPISLRGGTEPLWARDGRELFYREGSRLMMIRVGDSVERFVAGEPEVLFDDLRLGEWSGFGADTANYDVAPDGSRFLMAIRKNAVTATVIDVVLNWPQTLLDSASPAR